MGNPGNLVRGRKWGIAAARAGRQWSARMMREDHATGRVHGRVRPGSLLCSIVRTLAELMNSQGASWGANGGRHRATPGDIRPPPVQLNGTSGHARPCSATAQECLLSSRPQVRILLGALRKSQLRPRIAIADGFPLESVTSFVPHSCHAASDVGASGYSPQAPAVPARQERRLRRRWPGPSVGLWPWGPRPTRAGPTPMHGST